MKKYLAFVALISAPLLAQHEHMQMSQDLARDFLMGEASGTSHDPAAAAMHMSMTTFEKWMLMAHGNAFVSQVVQSGPRGGDQFFSTNWVMGMAERPLAGGHLMLRSMLSLEPLTVGKRGYPELFQVGEGLTDRQHPHDFFMELAAQFAVDLGHETVGYIYAAPVGDPALGPVAFPHRASAAEIPQAPLSHHLQDSTHIASSVVTIGAKQNAFGVGISAFRGREPDDNRWNIDKGTIDSWSIRGTWDPNPNWSAQFSTGHLQHPEAEEPGNIQRTTASIAHSDGEWSSTLVWGWNHKSHDDGHALLAETNRRFNVSNYLTGRFEIVRGVKALTGGYTKDIFRSRDLLGGVGGNVTVYRRADEHPVSFYAFVRLRSPSSH